MSPVKTIIRNKQPNAFAANFIGKSPVWLAANSDTTVDFEIWSVATDSQRTAIKTLFNAGLIELKVQLMGSNGEYTTVDFDPIGGNKKIIVPAKPAEQPAGLNTMKQRVDERDHIVKVGSPESKATLESFGAKPVGFKDDEILPPREVKNGTPEEKKEDTPKAEEVKGDAGEESAVAESGEDAPKKASKKSSKQKA